jgi:DNA-binding NarL/FixJ family response regulator
MVVDDHPMTRNGIADWIRREQDLSVCAEVQNAEQALDAVSKSKPDLVLTDITLPGKSGLELIKDLRAMRPDLPVLVFSMHD